MRLPRSLSFRLALAVVLSLFVCVLSYAGLGALLCLREGWAMRLFGVPRYVRLCESYERVADALLPGDRDGDGACDGREFFARTDAENPKDHPLVLLRRETDGIFAADPNNARAGVVFQRLVHLHDSTTIWIATGERVHARYFAGKRAPAPFPRDFRVRIVPMPELMIGRPGGPLASEELVLPVTGNGCFSFDLQFRAENLSRLSHLSVFNAATGAPLLTAADMHSPRNPGQIDVYQIRKLQTFTPAVELFHAAPNSNIESGAFRVQPARHKTLSVFKWPAAPDSATYWLLEAARDQDNTTWHPIDLLEKPQTSCVIQRLIAGPRQPYAGPLKYRVTAFRYQLD